MKQEKVSNAIYDWNELKNNLYILIKHEVLKLT